MTHPSSRRRTPPYPPRFGSTRRRIYRSERLSPSVRLHHDIFRLSRGVRRHVAFVAHRRQRRQRQRDKGDAVLANVPTAPHISPSPRRPFTTSDRARCDASTSHRVDRQPRLPPVMLNGKGPYRFIFDTGISTSSTRLSPKRRHGRRRSFRAAASTTESISFANLRFKSAMRR